MEKRKQLQSQIIHGKWHKFKKNILLYYQSVLEWGCNYQ